MKVLVTGGAGYIGSVLLPMLSLNGHEVTVLDDFRYGPGGIHMACASPDVHVVKGDARDMRVIRPLVAKSDAVVALAAVVGAPACDADPDVARQTNLDAVTDLCDVMSSDQLLAYPNTNSGYGIGDDRPCTEDSPLKPVSLYGRLKVAAERRVMERINSVAFRFATCFGVSPRMRTDLMVNDFVLRAVTDRHIDLFQSDARRNFVHVRGAAFAFCLALARWDDMKSQVYNCGDSRANMTKAQLCGIIARHVEFAWGTCDGVDPDRRDYLVLNDKIEAAGWRPQVSLDDGIKELLKYYTAAPQRCGNA